MTIEPLVSIYIICFNHEKYVAQAIDSVLSQSYKNLELIVVDNNSTDGSRKIIESYRGKDNRINFCFLDENTYVSYASNFAIKQCQGEYICGLASDDYFEKEKIEVQLEYMQKNNFFNCFTWVNTVNDMNTRLVDSQLEKLFNQKYLPSTIKKHFIFQENVLCAATCLLHHSIFDKYGYYDNRLLQSQDHEMWLRIIKNEDINILPIKLTNYRIRDDGENLSINMNEKSINRSRLECIYFGRHVLEFDLNSLSQALEVQCTHENKYKNLFEFYNHNEQPIFASAILFTMYEDLGPQFDFPSKIYKDFFEIYSNYDLIQDNKMNHLIEIVNTKDEQIIELNEIVRKKESQIFNFSRVKQLIMKYIGSR